MSKFRIYRADSSDPALIGRINKKLYVAYTALLFLIMFTINIHTSLKRGDTAMIIFYVILSVLILVVLYLIVKMQNQSKNLKKIGTLEFTKSFVKKEIGDLRSSYPYENIESIELEKHLRALTSTASKTGSLTHIIKIIHKNSASENFIIAGTSLDYKSKISIIETLKTLNKVVGIKTLINNN
jgi:hypothetical protein